VLGGAEPNQLRIACLCPPGARLVPALCPLLGHDEENLARYMGMLVTLTRRSARHFAVGGCRSVTCGGHLNGVGPRSLLTCLCPLGRGRDQRVHGDVSGVGLRANPFRVLLRLASGKGLAPRPCFRRGG
jgi:hypothetical protein